jgi:ABC-type transport system involved in cytochrome c biogenesis permease component
MTSSTNTMNSKTLKEYKQGGWLLSIVLLALIILLFIFSTENYSNGERI